MILDKFPDTEEFYKTYWGKKPFIVRKAIDKNIFDTCIDGDTLAGLSLEEDIKSRLVITEPQENTWTCHHGPLEEDIFSQLGEENWALLVQNVEQYHTDTAKLLQQFNFAPRWLMDDIMVSYSATGGSVGPHTDSYHVFLVQGIGEREWKISNAPVENEEYIDGQDLKVLKNGFDGETVIAAIGDVIYIPPHFAHEGTTIKAAMTFSVGFLGPHLSEILAEYSYHLEQNEDSNLRYAGQNLNAQSAGFLISAKEQTSIQDHLINALRSDAFAAWMASYFSAPTHDEVGCLDAREAPLSEAEIIDTLKSGAVLSRDSHVKLTLTSNADGSLNLAVYGTPIETEPVHKAVLDYLNTDKALTMDDITALDNKQESLALITQLYNQGVLSFDE
jgi:50S ribosomal protein L16 3-hydroxylase